MSLNVRRREVVGCAYLGAVPPMFYVARHDDGSYVLVRGGLKTDDDDRVITWTGDAQWISGDELYAMWQTLGQIVSPSALQDAPWEDTRADS